MEVEAAQDILSHIVAQRVRWGQQYDASDIGMDKIVDALLALAHAEDDGTADLRKSLATANRQAGAGKAREVKLKKTIEELRDEITNLDAIVDQLLDSRDTEGSTEDGVGED
jgi:hypothetical protein